MYSCSGLQQIAHFLVKPYIYFLGRFLKSVPLRFRLGELDRDKWFLACETLQKIYGRKLLTS
jgi:hypothetical protein